MERLIATRQVMAHPAEYQKAEALCGVNAASATAIPAAHIVYMCVYCDVRVYLDGALGSFAGLPLDETRHVCGDLGQAWIVRVVLDACC
jgi:hypothetical protein